MSNRNQLDQYDQYGKYGCPAPMSHQMMMQQNMGMSNIRQSFATQNTLIDRQDFTNKGNVIHNNLGEKIFCETVNEYKLHINSADRDTDKYPSPFNMKLELGSSLKAPYITRKFENVKYVNLDTLVLPRSIEIDTSRGNFNETGGSGYASAKYLYQAGTKYKPIYRNNLGAKLSTRDALNPDDEINILDKRRFLIVKIQELTTNKTLGTSTLFDRDTFVIVPDYDSGYDNWVWKPLHNSRVTYPNSQLHSISELTFQLLDENGKELTLYDASGNNILTTATANLNNKTYNQYVNDNISEKSVAYTNGVTQVWYNMTFGVSENEMNTLVNYN